MTTLFIKYELLGNKITYDTPELLIAKDYYPFGMEMSGRYTGAGNEDPDNKYRFGFQGQEKNDDWTGQTGSHLDFKYRVYDARIGRFFAIDPLASKYPYNSTYAFSENRVIDRIELEGLETSGIPLSTQPFNKNPEGLPVTKDYSMNPRVKLAVKGSIQVIGGVYGTIEGLAVTVGSGGTATVVGLGLIALSSSNVYMGMRNLGVAIDGADEEEAPKYGSFVGVVAEFCGADENTSNIIDNGVGLLTLKAPTPQVSQLANIVEGVQAVESVVEIAYDGSQLINKNSESKSDNSTNANEKVEMKVKNTSVYKTVSSLLND